MQSDQSNRSRRIRHHRTVVLLPFLALAGCAESGPEATETVAAGCDSGAQLSTRLYGAMPADLNWQADDLVCAGMPRPDGDGARIRLSGPLSDAPDANTVAFILGLPKLEQGRVARELATHVTFMEEGTGRFFGTADMSGCWTDVDFQEAVPDAPGSTYRIGGTVYCVSPLAQLNGGGSVSFNELTFTTRLNWDQPK